MTGSGAGGGAFTAMSAASAGAAILDATAMEIMNFFIDVSNPLCADRKRRSHPLKSVHHANRKCGARGSACQNGNTQSKRNLSLLYFCLNWESPESEGSSGSASQFGMSAEVISRLGLCGLIVPANTIRPSCN